MRDTEFLHAATKGIRVKIQDFGGAARSVDDPVRLPEDLRDVIAFHPAMVDSREVSAVKGAVDRVSGSISRYFRSPG